MATTSYLLIIHVLICHSYRNVARNHRARSAIYLYSYYPLLLMTYLTSSLVASETLLSRVFVVQFGYIRALHNPSPTLRVHVVDTTDTT